MAVVVEKVLGLVDAVGKAIEGVASALLRIGVELVDKAVERGLSQPLHHLDEAPGAQGVGRDLGAEVAGRLLLGADIGDEHLENVGIQPAASGDLHHRQHQALLIDLAASRQTPRLGAADVDMMGQVGSVSDNVPLMEDGRQDDDVVQVHAALVGIVGGQLVA